MTRLVFLHGFTQTGNSWKRIRELLPEFETEAPDLPGHGANTDGRRNLWSAAREAASAGSAVYVGYSFGARVALHCALLDPRTPTGLVLISGTAGIDDAGERTSRREADERLADRILRIGADPFLDEWLDQPMFADLDTVQADRASRVANTAEGLADSLRHCGTGTQEPLWNRLAEIELPVLILAGARDEKFAALARRLADGLGNSSLSIVEGCGHSVPFESPEITARLIRNWIAETFPGG